MQIINDPSFGELFGKQLGTGLGSALQGLAHQKVNALQRQHSAQTFQQGGYNPETANILSLLAEQNPQKLPEILAMLGAGQGQQGEQQQEGQTPNFAESIGRAQQIKQQESPAQIKAQEENITKRDKVLHLYNLARNMREGLDKGVVTGLGADILGKLSPYVLAQWYGEPTAQYAQQSADFVNAKAEALKGVVSKARLNLFERAKPGLDKSSEVNKRSLEDVEKESLRQYKEMVKRHPYLAIPEFDKEIGSSNGQGLSLLTPSKAKQIIAQELPKLPSKEYPDGTVVESDEGYQFEVKNNKWTPYQEGE